MWRTYQEIRRCWARWTLQRFNQCKRLLWHKWCVWRDVLIDCFCLRKKRKCSGIDGLQLQVWIGQPATWCEQRRAGQQGRRGCRPLRVKGCPFFMNEVWAIYHPNLLLCRRTSPLTPARWSQELHARGLSRESDHGLCGNWLSPKATWSQFSSLPSKMHFLLFLISILSISCTVVYSCMHEKQFSTA